MLDFEKMPRFKDSAYRIIELIPVWALAYKVDEKAIIRQIPIAYAWMISNPPPKKRITHFLNNWMGNAKRFGNLVENTPSRNYIEDRPPEDEIVDADTIEKARSL